MKASMTLVASGTDEWRDSRGYLRRRLHDGHRQAHRQICASVKFPDGQDVGSPEIEAGCADRRVVVMKGNWQRGRW